MNEAILSCCLRGELLSRSCRASACPFAQEQQEEEEAGEPRGQPGVSVEIKLNSVKFSFLGNIFIQPKYYKVKGRKIYAHTYICTYGNSHMIVDKDLSESVSIEV